jgi:hypothetical protein
LKQSLLVTGELPGTVTGATMLGVKNVRVARDGSVDAVQTFVVVANPPVAHVPVDGGPSDTTQIGVVPAHAVQTPPASAHELASIVVHTAGLPHNCCPLGHVHIPARQFTPTGHLMLQAPQLSASVSTLVQTPLHVFAHAVQALVVQVPDAHTWPHDPQLLGLLAKFTQVTVLPEMHPLEADEPPAVQLVQAPEPPTGVQAQVPPPAEVQAPAAVIEPALVKVHEQVVGHP